MVEKDKNNALPNKNKAKKNCGLYSMATEEEEGDFTREEKRYYQIDSYGVIGNLRSCAHICGKNGSLDWFCFPYFNSPSLFGRILDYEKGGFFQVTASTKDKHKLEVKQSYWPDTNILITKFSSQNGIGQVIDFMPVVEASKNSSDPENNPNLTKHLSEDSDQVRSCIGSASLLNTVPHFVSEPKCEETDKYMSICRRVEVIQGQVFFSMKCFPAFNYARDDHVLHITKDRKKAIFMSKDLSMTLEASSGVLKAAKSPLTKNKGAVSQFILSENSCLSLVFRQSTDEEIKEAREHQTDDATEVELDEKNRIISNYKPESIKLEEFSFINAKVDWLFIQTMTYWHNWIGKCKYQGRWREHIYRSALILKLMTFEPTGAIVAAPTTSLPENIGGTRNWDYRYTWLRDAAYVVYSFIRVGFYQEAESFMRFLEERCKESIKEDVLEMNIDSFLKEDHSYKVCKKPPLKVIYSINGKDEMLEEKELNHLEGYKGSKPVRIGNAASSQLQLDVYGELLDAIYLYNKYSKPVSYDFWRYIVYIVNWVCENFNKPDEGLWEVRGGKKHFLYSKVLCWVCIDRGLRLADKRSFPCPRVYWQKKRDELMTQIMRQGYNSEIGAFTQYYGSKNLDAGALILPLVLFMAPTDPRMVSTLKAINRNPKKGGLVLNSLVYRYDVKTTDDGLGGIKEGTFNMCTFWLIECLARTGKKQLIMEAQLKLEQFFTYLSSVGLFSEEMSSDGHQLGNYPQCFTHLALISAAFNLNRALNDWRPMTQST